MIAKVATDGLACGGRGEAKIASDGLAIGGRGHEGISYLGKCTR